MELEYLLFDFSDEDSGAGSFDALATVATARLPQVRDEVAAVLAWATAAFGAPQADGEWDYELQETPEPGGHVAVALTVGGSEAFCNAMRREFVIA